MPIYKYYTAQGCLAQGIAVVDQSTEVGFANFLSGGFTTMAVINPPERKLAKRTSVHFRIFGCNDTMGPIVFSIHI